MTDKFSKAGRYFEQGDYARALTEFATLAEGQSSQGLLGRRNQGICLYKLKRFVEAKETLLPLLASQPNDLQLLEYLGLTLHELHDAKAALPILEGRLGMNTPVPDTIYIAYVNCCEQLNSLDRCEQLFHRLANTRLLSKVGVVLYARLLKARGDIDSAVALIESAGDDSDAYLLKELALLHKKRAAYDLADVYLKKAMLAVGEQVGPLFEEIARERIHVHVLGGTQEALQGLIESYLSVFPYDDARIFATDCYISKNMLVQARTLLDKIADPATVKAQLHFLRSNLARAENNPIDSITESLKALHAGHVDKALYQQIGLALADLSMHALSAKVCEYLLDMDPNCAQTRWNLSVCQFLLGDYEQAFKNAEARWRLPEALTSVPSAAAALMPGDSIAGKSILVFVEQGLGDTLQFSRYLSLMNYMGARVTAKVQGPLVQLLTRCMPEVSFVEHIASDQQFDYQIALLSLPYYFGTIASTVPVPKRLIQAMHDKVSHWEAQLSSTKGRRIGVAWSGNPIHRNDKNRSISFEQFKTIFNSPDQFVCLQKGVTHSSLTDAPSNLICFGDDIQDFEDVAALAELCDLIVTVDSAPLHLAASMDKPTWLLLPRPCDWRWMAEGETSVWYPSVKVFRQGIERNWQSVLEMVRTQLAA